MCTLALFVNVLDGCPLLVAANRDERYDRPTARPGVIASNPRIVAGKDLVARGTWLGVNEHGLLAGILNRRVRNRMQAPGGTRSRGLLCLDVLGLAGARHVAEFLSAQDHTYEPFTLVYADLESAGIAYNQAGRITVGRLGDGLHVFSSAAQIDAYSEKANRARSRFASWANGIHETGDLDLSEGLQNVLSDHAAPDGGDARDAICVHGAQSGTVSSSIIDYSAARRRFRSRYCAGAPCQNSFAEPLVL